MAELVRAAQLAPVTRETALALIRRPRPAREGVERIAEWVRRRVWLVNEPVEMIHRPEWMLAEMAAGRAVWGDCDDAALLVATLATAVGVPARFVAIRPDGAAEFVHVFTEVFCENHWRAIDTTTRRRPPAQWERMVVEV